MSRYCEPYAGGVWRSELHGVVIRSRAVCLMTHDAQGVRLAEVAMQARVPTGVPVPLGIVPLLVEAIEREPKYLGASASASETAAIVADAAIEREMLFVRARELLAAARREEALRQDGAMRLAEAARRPIAARVLIRTGECP